MAKADTTKKNKEESEKRRPRRRLGPDTRRSELLDAALTVLKESGPRARVEDITRVAGAAKGTFYLYFPSWNDLLIAVRDHLMSIYASEIRARISAARAVDWALIEGECMRFVDVILELGELHKAVFHAPSLDHEIRYERVGDSLIAEIIAQGVAAGACRPVDPQTAAPLLFSVIHAAADTITRTGDREATFDTVLDLLRVWLRSDAETNESR